VRELDRIADIIKERTDELSSLQRSHSEMKFKINPKTYTDRLNKITSDAGKQIVELDVPRTPKLYTKGKVITVKIPVGPKGRAQKTKKKRKK